MNIIEIPDAGIKRYIPSDLSECSSQEYIDMSELILLYQTGQLDYNQFKVHAVYKLLKIELNKEEPVANNSEKELQKWYNVSMLTNLIDSFFEENSDKQQVIKQYYIHNPIPKIKFWKTYHGPSDQFSNITFAEYTDALRLFLDFSASGEVEYLYLIAAIFYRPAKYFHFIRKQLNSYDGDIRIKYNANTIEARAAKFKYLPIGFIYGVFLLFASYQKFISSSTITWGGREIDLSILFDSTGDEQESDLPGLGLDSVMFSLVESGVFGTKTETMATNNWNILIRMYDIRKRDIDQQKQQQNDNTASS